MKYKLICVGKIKEDFYRKIIENNTKNLNKKVTFQIIELQDEKTPDKASDAIEEKIKQIEGSRILEKINDKDYVIALAIDGKKDNTIEFGNLLSKIKDMSYENITIVIGGSLGLSQEVLKRADYKLSFSNMTFPHQLMRVMLTEQLCQIFSK